MHLRLEEVRRHGQHSASSQAACCPETWGSPRWTGRFPGVELRFPKPAITLKPAAALDRPMVHPSVQEQLAVVARGAARGRRAAPRRRHAASPAEGPLSNGTSGSVTMLTSRVLYGGGASVQRLGRIGPFVEDPVRLGLVPACSGATRRTSSRSFAPYIGWPGSSGSAPEMIAVTSMS